MRARKDSLLCKKQFVTCILRDNGRIEKDNLTIDAWISLGRKLSQPIQEKVTKFR